MNLQEHFGHIDIYLFDQLLKGRFENRRVVLDVGCGRGRNLVYLLRNGFDVFAIDRDAEAVGKVRDLAAKLAPETPRENFQMAGAERIPWTDSRFDVVMANAVLHFADDEDNFNHMVDEIWRVLKSGGLFFARLASTIGIEGRVQNIRERWYRLPDGSERFLVDEARLLRATERLGGTLLDPLKTTNVQNQRCMTTWCLRKGA